MSLLCHSWTCPACLKTWISAVGAIKRCEKCGLPRGGVYGGVWRNEKSSSAAFSTIFGDFKP